VEFRRKVLSRHSNAAVQNRPETNSSCRFTGCAQSPRRSRYPAIRRSATASSAVGPLPVRLDGTSRKSACTSTQASNVWRATQCTTTACVQRKTVQPTCERVGAPALLAMLFPAFTQSGPASGIFVSAAFSIAFLGTLGDDPFAPAHAITARAPATRNATQFAFMVASLSQSQVAPMHVRRASLAQHPGRRPGDPLFGEARMSRTQVTFGASSAGGRGYLVSLQMRHERCVAGPRCHPQLELSSRASVTACSTSRLVAADGDVVRTTGILAPLKTAGRTHFAAVRL
jgi:hypothetical protein